MWQTQEIDSSTKSDAKATESTMAEPTDDMTSLEQEKPDEMTDEFEFDEDEFSETTIESQTDNQTTTVTRTDSTTTPTTTSRSQQENISRAKRSSRVFPNTTPDTKNFGNPFAWLPSIEEFKNNKHSSSIFTIYLNLKSTRMP